MRLWIAETVGCLLKKALALGCLLVWTWTWFYADSVQVQRYHCWILQEIEMKICDLSLAIGVRLLFCARHYPSRLLGPPLDAEAEARIGLVDLQPLGQTHRETPAKEGTRLGVFADLPFVLILAGLVSPR